MPFHYENYFYIDRKRDAMDIYVIDRTILECDEIVLPPASSTGNDNFGENIPNHDLLSTDADIETIYILLSLKLHLLCEPFWQSIHKVNENQDLPEINNNLRGINKNQA